MTLTFLLAIVFCASFVLTMVGLGGGLVFSPVFVVLGLPVPAAVSASLFLNGIAAFSAGITYYRKKMIDLKTAVPLLVSSTLTAPLGAFLTGAFDLRLFSVIMAVVIFLAALRMLFSGRADPEVHEAPARGGVIGGGVIGLGVGLMAGLLGIGGGVLIVPLLIYGLRMPAKKAAATSIFIVVFSSFSGFAAHVSLSGVDWGFVLPAAVFSFAGGQLGSRIMAGRLNSVVIRRILGGVLLVLFVKILQQAVR